MGYWVTTQWPQLRSERKDSPSHGVWVASEKAHVIAPMESGDLVWVYESLSGRSIRRRLANGDERVETRHKGRGGVIGLTTVLVPPAEDPGSEPEEYVGGSRIWWRWFAPTRVVNSAGFISRVELNEVLGYKPDYPLRAFGTAQSGLMSVGEDVHRALLERFLGSYADEELQRLERGRQRPRGGGGEGPVHLALKNAIAADPSGVLGEPGLRLVQVEYAFGATGDCIDVLLKDAHGAYVAVEVEPDCPQDHVAGPLQCMKYRALLAYHFSREPEEVRTILVSHGIHEAVREKAGRYGIASYVVAKPQGGRVQFKRTTAARVTGDGRT